MLSVFTERCGCDFDSVYAILILAGWGGTRLCAIPLNDIVCIANIELGGRGGTRNSGPPTKRFCLHRYHVFVFNIYSFHRQEVPTLLQNYDGDDSYKTCSGDIFFRGG